MLTLQVMAKCRASEGMDKAGKAQMHLLTLILQWNMSANTEMPMHMYNKKKTKRTFLSGACTLAEWCGGMIMV